ncbi:MAG: helix-turn-helix transcriptional regulator [Erythrobacter sp.]
MINRIREFRRAGGLTLADLAAACDPPTTAQTIGRLETGTRNLSTKWIDRIGSALGVDPGMLVRSEAQPRAKVVAEIGEGEPRPLDPAREAILPTEMAAQGTGGEALIVAEITAPIGAYRAGDTLWLKRIADGDEAAVMRAFNCDCLIARPGGRYAFGRLIDRQGKRVGILPAEAGVKQMVIDRPEWIARAIMLVRPL